MKFINLIIMFLILISAVYAQGVEILPLNPNTDDDLRCSYNGVTSGFNFRWFVNNVYVRSGSILDDSYSNVLDNIKCDAWMVMPSQDVYVGTGYTKIINRDPIISDIQDINFNEDSVYLIDLTGYATDPDNDPLTWSVSGNVNINVEFSDSVVRLIPNADWFGVETLIFTARDNHGGAASDSVIVSVNNVDDVPVIESFSPATPVNINEGSSQIFSVVVREVDGDIISYEWYLDNVLVSTGNNYIFNSIDGPDDHILNVIVSDGISDITNRWVINEVNVNPGVSVFNNGPVNEGQTVVFNVNINDPGVLDTHLFSFDFNDDGIYDVVDQFSNSASYIFTDAGSYDVNIRVKDKDNGVGYGVSNVVVNNVLPVADAGGGYVCQIGRSITLVGNNNGYLGDLVEYAWDLDDDGVYDDSSLKNPVYSCNSLGLFDIGLRVTDDENSFSIDSTTIDVTNVPVNNAPVFSPALQDQSAVVGQLFSYDIDAVDPDLDPITFSDDTTLFNINSNTGLISFVPSSSGLYTIMITVCDVFNACTSDSFDLNIQMAQNTAPDVNIVNPDDGDSFNVGNNIMFEGVANDLEDGGISNLIQWSSSIDGMFGNGAIINTDTLSVGTHVITSRIIDSGGLQDSDMISINVITGITQCNDGLDNDGDGLIDLNDDGCVNVNDLSEQENPVASFSVSDTTVGVNEVVNFNASGSDDIDGIIVSYSWDFGDGVTGSGVSVSHSYSQIGVYNVILTVRDNDGLIDNEIVQINVSSVVPSVTGLSGDLEKVRHELVIENLKVVNDVVIFDIVNKGNVKEVVDVELIIRELGIVDKVGSFSLNKDSRKTVSDKFIGEGKLTIEVRVYNKYVDISESIDYNIKGSEETKFISLDSQGKIVKESMFGLVIWGLLVLLMIVLIILGLDYSLNERL